MTNTMECEGSVYVKDHACRLTLHINESSIAIYDLVSRKHIHEIDLTSVVGAEALSGSSSSNRSILHLYDYGFNDGLSLLSSISCMSSRRHRACHVIELQFADASTCRSWANAINIITSSPVTPTVTSTNVSSWMTSPPPRRKFLVLVNPASGPGNALSIWKDEVQPMLIHACIDVKLVVTQYANHARKLIRETGNANGDELELGVSSLLEFDCIVIVAGDGLVFEVINGIADRSDAHQIMSMLPIAAVPGGTGNGLAKSVLFECGEECTALNAVFVGLKGQTAPLDLSLVTTTDNQRFHSFLLLGWGLIADIDLKSEGMRWMGETRLYMAALYFAVQHKRYRGRLSFFTGTVPHIISNGATTAANIPSVVLPPLDQEIDTTTGGWEVLDGAFLLVWVIQTSHCTTSTYSGPGVHIDDGMFTVFVVEDMSVGELLHLLVIMDTGGHINHPKVKTFKCTAYRITPTTDASNPSSPRSSQASGAMDGESFTLDGERVPCASIQAVMLPAAARVKKLHVI